MKLSRALSHHHYIRRRKSYTSFNFWHSDALALSPEHQSTRMSKIKNDGLDQYGTGPFEQQQFGTAGIEGVKRRKSYNLHNVLSSSVSSCK